MKVTVRNIESQLGNNGITLYIADNEGHHKGKLRIGQATVEWCQGRIHMGNGKRILLRDFIEMLNNA